MAGANSTLRTRLIAASVLVSLFALVAANSLAYFGLRHTLIERVDASLRTVALPKSGRGPRFPSSFYFGERAPSGAIAHEVLATDDNGMQIRPRLPNALDLAGTTSDPTGTARFLTVPAEGSGSRFRVKASNDADGRALIIAATLDDAEQTLGRTLHNQVLITMIVSALTALLAAFGVQRNLQPLSQLQNTAAAVARGDRKARTAPSGARDVRDLSVTFNHMVDELNQAIESEKQAAAVTRTFVDNAAHELRTPTTAILAYTQLLHSEHPRTDEENRRIVHGMLSEGDRLKRLIDELLFLARADQRSIAPTVHGPLDLSAIATQAVDASLLVGPSWPVDLVTPEQCWIHGSATELRQVIDNLLVNIRTHTPAGTSGLVLIQAFGKGATITVEDDGPGIATEDATHIFDRFWRGDDSRTRTTGGNGLGLSIVKAIVEAHSGSVKTEARPGGGTRIVLTFVE